MRSQGGFHGLRGLPKNLRRRMPGGMTRTEEPGHREPPTPRNQRRLAAKQRKNEKPG